MWCQDEGWRDGCHCSFIGPPLGHLQTRVILTVLSSPPARPFLKLHLVLCPGCSTSCLPGIPPHPTHKFPMVSSLPASQPHSIPPLSCTFIAGNSFLLLWPIHALHILWETWWWTTGASSSCIVSRKIKVGSLRPWMPWNFC